MDVREGPAVFGPSKTLGLISGSLISLALDPAAGMKLDAGDEAGCRTILQTKGSGGVAEGGVRPGLPASRWQHNTEQDWRVDKGQCFIGHLPCARHCLQTHNYPYSNPMKQTTFPFYRRGD